MSPPRLLAVTGTGQVSGAERVLVRVLAAAVEAGWDVTCAVPRGPLEGELAAVGVPTCALPELGLAAGPRPVAAARTMQSWARAARRIRREAREADVVLVNSLTALPAARLVRPPVPVVWLAHDVLVRRDRLRLYRACRPRLSMVVGVSAAVADRLRGGGTRVEVVRNGVEWPVEPVTGSEAAPPAVIGLNALLVPWKGHHVLLDAVPLLPADVVVELMGGDLPKDADYAAGVRRRASRPGLHHRVRLLGHVADPLDRMRAWTVAVSASTEPEANPLNVLEAMSLGIPVVGTDHGGTREVLRGAGMLVPPGDATALAAAIRALLEDPVLRQRCAAAGRQRIAAEHRLDVQTRRLLALLAEEARA